MDAHAVANWVWIPIVVFAAAAQTVRNAAQRNLANDIGTLPATLVRFLYGLPFAAAWLALVYAFGAGAQQLPAFGIVYGLWLFLGASGQLVATALLLVAMRQRNFIVGVTFSKTELLQVGLLAMVVLQEIPTPLTAVAMFMATVGVVLLSMPPPGTVGQAGWRGNAAWFGLASGAFFALSAVGYRGAALALPGTSAWLIGAWAVLLAQLVQSGMLGAWLVWRQPGALAAIARAWRLSTLAGMTGTMASAGWMTAMAMRPAVDVRTVGLVEVLFSYLVSRKLFKEQVSRRELVGLLLIGAGVVVVSAQI